VNGRAVRATFSRTNGCEIDRWQRISPWLVPPGGVRAEHAVVTIGGRDDRPLRRRGTTSARAIEQARARGLRVAAVDRNADAPGLAAADVAEVVDFTDVRAVVEVARPDRRWTACSSVSADRAVPVVAGGAGDARPPGIGTRRAHLLDAQSVRCETHSVAAGCRSLSTRSLRSSGDIDAALATSRLPGGLKPGRLGRTACRVPDREPRRALSAILDEAIAESPTTRRSSEELRRGGRAERNS
jgi:hypothetical protein